MSPDQFELGDVFWAPDPYNAAGNPRPWLVVSAGSLPYSGEEYICVGLTLSNLPDNIEVRTNDWVAGNNPEKVSYCSPWVLATVKHEAVVGAQGYVTEEFAEEIAERSAGYVKSDLPDS